MSKETASIHANAMIKTLLSIHALTNMHRASENHCYRDTAREWIPILKSQLSSLERELADIAERSNP